MPHPGTAHPAGRAPVRIPYGSTRHDGRCAGAGHDV